MGVTGSISLRNLRRVARELDENMSEDELRAMIEEFDTDNDGESKFKKKRGKIMISNLKIIGLNLIMYMVPQYTTV